MVFLGWFFMLSSIANWEYSRPCIRGISQAFKNCRRNFCRTTLPRNSYGALRAQFLWSRIFYLSTQAKFLDPVSRFRLLTKHRSDLTNVGKRMRFLHFVTQLSGFQNFIKTNNILNVVFVIYLLYFKVDNLSFLYSLHMSHRIMASNKITPSKINECV